MTQNVKLKIDVSACGDTKASVQPEIAVEACGKIQETVMPGETVKLTVQPGPKILFLFMTSNQYKDLSYWLDKNGGGTGNPIAFGTVQMYVGEGISAALDSPVEKLWIRNDGDEDANVELLVGRQANDSQDGDGADGNGEGGDGGDGGDTSNGGNGDTGNGGNGEGGDGSSSGGKSKDEGDDETVTS